MRLLLTELSRFWGRRLTLIVTGITLVLISIISFAVFTQSSNDSEPGQDALAEASANAELCKQDVEALVESGEDTFLQQEKDSLSEEEFNDFVQNEVCYQDPTWYGKTPFRATEILGSQGFDEGFDENGDSNSAASWSEIRPTNEELIVTNGPNEYREARGGLEGVVPSTALFFLMIAIITGASFVGAEYKFGTLENLLLWEPRRLRVLWTKYLAGFLSSVVLTAIVLAFATALLLLVAELRGSTAGLDGRFWQDLASTIGRASLTGGLFFVLSMSIAVIAKNTTAAVGAVLGWFVVSNIVVELLAKWFRQWELFVNAAQFISEGDAVKYERVSGEWVMVYGHSYLLAGALVAVWALFFAGVASVLFARRDID